MIIKMIQNLKNSMEKIQESFNIFNKGLEEIKNKQTVTNNTITEIKNTLEGINSRLTEAEEWISELEDRMVEITAEEQNKDKEWKELQVVLETGTILNWMHQHSNYRGPRRRKEEIQSEKNFEEIIVENFPNMGKKKQT